VACDQSRHWHRTFAFPRRPAVTLGSRCVVARTRAGACGRCLTQSHRHPGHLAFAVAIALALAFALALAIVIASALPLGLTQPEPGASPKPEPKRFGRPVAHALLTALDKLA